MSTNYRELRRAVDDVNTAEDIVEEARNKLCQAETRLGRALRACREAKGLSLRECAKRLSLSAPFLSDVERGRRHLSTGHLECYMSIVGPISMQEIFEKITHNKITPTDNETKIC